VLGVLNISKIYHCLTIY